MIPVYTSSSYLTIFLIISLSIEYSIPPYISEIGEQDMTCFFFKFRGKMVHVFFVCLLGWGCRGSRGNGRLLTDGWIKLFLWTSMLSNKGEVHHYLSSLSSVIVWEGGMLDRKANIFISSSVCNLLWKWNLEAPYSWKQLRSICS